MTAHTIRPTWTAMRLMGGLSVAALMAGTAFAQAAAPAESQGGLEEIVVTAQKRAENIQSVPISVSAVTGEKIEQMQAVTIQGLQGSVPNIQINNFSNTPNTAAITIRGIGVIEPDPYAGNTVSVVVDGVPQYFSTGALVDLYDVRSIEVLRGPQGTLFGANTTGGVINVTSETPQDEFGGKAEVTVGNWNRLDVAAAINAPLIQDVLTSRISVKHHGRDGWVTNIVDGTDMGHRNVTILRGALKYTPTANFEANLIGEYVRARNGSAPVVAGNRPGNAAEGIIGDAEYIPAGTTFPLPVGAFGRPAGTPQIVSVPSVLPMYASPCPNADQRCNAPSKYYSAHAGVANMSNMDTYRGVLNLQWSDTAIGDITAITGYKHFEVNEATDQDGSPALLIDTYRTTKGWQLSQELRSSLDVTDSINLLFGGMYMKTHYDHVQNLRIEFAAPGLYQQNLQDQDNESISAFAHSFIDVTERLRLQAGIRYTHEKTQMDVSTATSINPAGTPSRFDGAGNISLGTVVGDGSKSWNNVGWKLGVDYKVTDDAMLYGYWSRGFKSGGFTGRIGLQQDSTPYDPEKVDTFELGLKADFFDRRLRTNLAGFYTSYRDMQIASIYFTTDANGTFVQGNRIINAGKSEIKGFELEVTALPVDGLTLSGSLAYLDSKYKEFDFFDAVQNRTYSLKGADLQNAPKWSGTAGIAYEFALGSGTMKSRVQYNYVGKKYLTAINNTGRATVQPTHVVDANLDWTPEHESWTIGLWARNLFDNRYIASVFDSPGTLGLTNYAPPREWGASFKYKF